jgi:hypothetical protein
MAVLPGIWPKEFKINDRFKARIGYKDSRFEVEYNTHVPLVGWYTLALQPADLPYIEMVFVAQDKWVELSKRKGGKAVIEMTISPQVKARIGFEDRHVEILVKVAIVNYTIPFKETEAPVIRAVVAEARKFNALNQAEKSMKGAP